MAKKAIVLANHENEPLLNLKFPYHHIKRYDFLFKSLEKNEEIEKFDFLIME